MPILLIISLLSLGAVIVTSVSFARGLKKMRSLDDIQPDDMADCPLVSIVVPACNEEVNIERSLLSLLAQEYGNIEIIVVNDRSTDNTPHILRKMQHRYPQLVVHEITQLPTGWLGKNHALSAGAALARGEYLLFTDADVVMEKTTIGRAVCYMDTRNLDHLTLIFKNLTGGWLLNALILDSTIGLIVLFKPWLAKKPGTRWFVGVGAFNMLRRSAYLAVGGHGTIRMHPIDDVMLGKILKNNGYAQDCLLGYNFVGVPWYDSVGAMVQGLEKNMFALLHYRLFLVPLGLCAIIIPNIWPLWAVALGDGFIRSICVTAVVIRLANFSQGLLRQGLSLWVAPACLLTPYISCYILIKSTFVTLKNKGIIWRGHHYPLNELRRTPPLLF